MLYQITGIPETVTYSCYSKEQAELLAQTPGINMLTSSWGNNMHLWRLFPHGALQGEVAAWHVPVLPASQGTSCSSGSQGDRCFSSAQGTPWGSQALRGDAHHSQIPKPQADGKYITCCSQREMTEPHPLALPCWYAPRMLHVRVLPSSGPAHMACLSREQTLQPSP